MDPIQALKEILQQLNDLSGAGLDLLHQATGGGKGDKGKPAEGSPAEERGESPREEATEPKGPEDRQPGGGGAVPAPPQRR